MWQAMRFCLFLGAGVKSEKQGTFFTRFQTKREWMWAPPVMEKSFQCRKHLMEKLCLQMTFAWWMDYFSFTGASGQSPCRELMTRTSAEKGLGNQEPPLRHWLLSTGRGSASADSPRDGAGGRGALLWQRGSRDPSFILWRGQALLYLCL